MVTLPIHSCFGPFNPDNPGMGILPEDTTKTKIASQVAYWKCDDTIELVNSASYSGLKGEFQPGISLDTGVGGTGHSLLFKTDTYVNVLTDSVLNLKKSDFTISLWCKPQKGNDIAILISKGTVDSANSLIVALSGNAPAIFSETVPHPITDTVIDGIWNHVAFVRESGGISIYLNSKKYSVGATSPDLENAKALRIGTSYDNKDYYHGNIDEIKIERKAWSDVEVNAEYTKFHK